MSYRHNPCYSESMPIGLAQEADSIFRIEMRGMLRKADLDRCQARVAAEMSRLGPVRLLFVLDGFAGWEPRDNWSDLTFYAKYSDCIDRIAIVGDERANRRAGSRSAVASREYCPDSSVTQAPAGNTGQGATASLASTAIAILESETYRN